jgi:hypothetical protein
MKKMQDLQLETIDVLLVIWDIGNVFYERHGVMKPVSMSLQEA